MSRLFTPYSIGSITLKNRIVMPPMCTYNVKNGDGIPTYFHEIHYGARALGGVGLIIIEATAVESRGRITNADLGLWSDEQIEAHKRLVSAVHTFDSKVAIQLAHAGRKSECIDSTPVAPSSLVFDKDFKTPHELTIDEINIIKNSFVESAKRAKKAGYDIIELHSAHGYLLSEFLSPLNNQRSDEYGSSLENRCRLTIEIAQEIIQEVGLPLIVRISSEEWVENGWSIEDSIYLSKALKDVGVAMIHVSAGGNHPTYTKMPKIIPFYMADYSKAIKQKASIPTIAVGLINTAQEGEALLLGDICELVAYGRVLLRSPNFALESAKLLKDDSFIPFSYKRAY